MKNCPFDGKPEYISMYHDGVMPREMEQRFSDHLTSCRSCSEALLNLQNDLFKLRSIDFRPVPSAVVAEVRKESAGEAGAEASGKKTLFRFADGVLRLIEDLSPKGEFSKQALSPARGKEPAVRSLYRTREGDTVVQLFSTGENRFGLELQGIRNRSVALVRNGRVIEERIDLDADRMIIDGLERGDYALMIDDEVFSIFRVD
jgi:hypothetical protein